MYDFNCLVYSTIYFEQTHTERLKMTTTINEPENATESNATTDGIAALEELDCSQSRLLIFA